MGAKVDEVHAYQSLAVAHRRDELIRGLECGDIHMVTFTSSSTVTNFKALLPPDGIRDLMEGITVAAIGPITAETAEKLGFNVDLVASEYTIPGLCEAIVAHMGR